MTNINIFKHKNSQNGGFIQLIVIIIIALLIMKYFGITLSGAWIWFKAFFNGVLM